ATDTSPGTSGSFAYTATAGEGTYSLYTVARDKAGNAEGAPASADSTTVLDLHDPTSAATSPAYSTSTTITVGYTAADSGSGLDKVELWVKPPGAAGYSKTATDASPAASGSFTYTAAAGDGSYSFYTRALDKAGNY